LRALCTPSGSLLACDDSCVTIARSLFDIIRSWTPGATIRVGVGAARRFVAISGIDRSMSVGAHAFTALIPLVLVLRALVGGAGAGSSSSDRMIERFHLTGSAAHATRILLTSSGGPSGFVATTVGLVVLLFSGVSLMRALQRAYTAAWGLEPIGISGYLDGAGALAFLLLEVFLVTRIATLLGGGVVTGIVSLLLRLAVGTAVWLLLQWLLLSRRAAWQVLLPGALLSAAGMIVVNWGSTLVMPHVITVDAARYGPIGVTFGLLTWFLVLAVVLVAGAVLSAEAGGAPALHRRSLSAETSAG
jgi:membrane protein